MENERESERLVLPHTISRCGAAGVASHHLTEEVDGWCCHARLRDVSVAGAATRHAGTRQSAREPGPVHDRLGKFNLIDKLINLILATEPQAERMRIQASSGMDTG